MPEFRRFITAILITLAVILPLTACNDTPPPAMARQIMTGPAAMDPDLSYICQDGSLLYTYYDSTPEDFSRLCRDYENQGYTLYNASVMGDNLVSTYVAGSAMVHIYRHGATGELNLVQSGDAGATLPPAIPEHGEEVTPCTVTQMMDEDSPIGMGYVVQLTDGSYILYDGSYESQVDRIEQFLLENHRGEGRPVIRAWVLTHSHQDHVEAFMTFAERARAEERFIVEHIIVSPLNPDEYTLNEKDDVNYLSGDFYQDAEAFTGAKVIFAHTGMTFAFGNLRMEVLYAPESHFKQTNQILYFNNTSLVTRLYDNNYSALFLGDVGHTGTDLMVEYYGDYLQSDMCQVSHHGLKDVPLSFYEVVQAPLLFFPCNQDLYNRFGDNGDVRLGLQEKPYTKEILIAGLAQYTRPWGTTFAADAPLSMPDYVPPNS